VVRSPKNSTSTPLRSMSRSHSRHTISLSLERLQHRLPAAGPSGTTVMPEVLAQIGEPLEQLGRLERLDHHGHLVPLVGHPPAGPLPATQVRQGEDHPVAQRSSAGGDVVETRPW
jgi:hypothetical protein